MYYHGKKAEMAPVALHLAGGRLYFAGTSHVLESKAYKAKARKAEKKTGSTL